MDVCEAIFNVLFDLENPLREFDLVRRHLLSDINKIILSDRLTRPSTLVVAANDATTAYRRQHVVARLRHFLTEEAGHPGELSLSGIAALIQVLQQVQGVHNAFVTQDVYVSLVTLLWKWIRKADYPTSGMMAITQVLFCVCR